MELQKRHYYQIAAGIIILILIGWLIVKNSKSSNQTPQDQTTNNSQTQQSQQQNSPSQVGNSMTGTLKLSDNLSKGNLMLVSSGHTTYLFTSRDFSSLVGQEVTVTYEGTPADFHLGNIVAK